MSVHFNADEFPCPASLPFESDRPPLEDIAFVEGFQTGRIYELLKADPDALNGYCVPSPVVPFVVPFVVTIINTLGNIHFDRIRR